MDKLFSFRLFWFVLCRIFVDISVVPLLKPYSIWVLCLHDTASPS